MRVRVERGRPRPPEQLAKGRPLAAVHAENEGVEEEADKPFHLATGAVGHGGADEEIGLPGSAVEQQGEAGEERHEERRPLAPAQRAQRRGDSRGHREGQARAPPARPGRPGPIGGDRERGRRAGEARAPVREQRLERARAQPLALPRREVRVLEGQGRQRGVEAGEAGAIRRGELAAQHVQGPAVAHDVVNGDDEHVVGVVEPQQARAPEGPAREVERTRGLVGEQTLGLRLARGRLDAVQIGHHEGDVGFRQDALPRPPVHADHYRS